MSKRIFNILFHTHTISGILISVMLFVIFFAGSFAFFRDEIINWEREETTVNQNLTLDFNKAIDSLKQHYPIASRDITFIKSHNVNMLRVAISEPKDSSVLENRKKQNFYIHSKTYQTKSYWEDYSLGEFLYRLHFFAQIPNTIGYYISGFTALFFLFAILTGLLIHWKKIVGQFFLFRPWTKLKTLWKDAHTTLGLIGLPFQFVYAVTGAFFMLKNILIAPVVFALYDGDSKKLFDDLEFGHEHVTWSYRPMEDTIDFNKLISQATNQWPEFELSLVEIMNYGDSSMHILCEGHVPSSNKMLSHGSVLIKANNGTIISQENPLEKNSYLTGVKIFMNSIHFGDYGGWLLRILSFILGLLTCFVIISGILIWLSARVKNEVSNSRRKFNQWTGWIYIGVCMSMFPVTALTFIAVLILESPTADFLYYFYFGTWLLLSALLVLFKNNYSITKVSLIAGASMGMAIPIFNGVIRQQWLWNSVNLPFLDIFFVDILWLSLSLLAGVILMFMKKFKPKEQQ